MLSNTQNPIIINTGKSLKVSKNTFNRYSGRVGSRTSEESISTVWNVRQFDIGQLECGISLAHHFRSSESSDKQDVEPATWTHINDYIHVCKCTEIFRNNLYSKVSKG